MTGWSKELFAKNLKRYMDEKGKTQKELAEIVGVSAPTVSDWLNAKKYPRIDKIEILANYFGIFKSDLIENPASAPMATAEEIGQLIKEARIQKGYSLEALAAKAGISTPALTKWEKGTNNTMTTGQIRLVACILELNPLLLLGFKDLGKRPEKITVSAADFSKEDFLQIKQFIEFMKNKKCSPSSSNL